MPKAQGKGKKEEAKKIYDYSDMEKGMRLQVESDGSWYAGEVVALKKKGPAPVKVSYKGYEGYDEWVGGYRIRSKALKV
jgi:hypothetical protein